MTKESEIPGRLDWLILLIMTALLMFSVPIVYSASSTIGFTKYGSSEKFLMSQVLRVFVALAITIIISRIDYHRYKSINKKILYMGISLLLLVFVMGSKMKGASRWLNLGAFSFQPSEFAKFALVIYLAAWLSDNQDRLNNFKEGIAPALLSIGIICGLIFLQPNFSTATIIGCISIMILYAGNIPTRFLGFIGLFSGIGIAIYGISAPYRVKRLLSYIGSDSATKDSNHQLKQAILAFGNGGFFGVGAGQSHMRDLFLPESYGDFISAIIGEEYGFIGIMFIMALFIIFTLRGLRIAKHAPDKCGSLLAFGITITISIYAFVNIGVNCGILPTTGLPLPFLSYGGTAVILSAIAVGILLNISSQAGLFPAKK